MCAIIAYVFGGVGPFFNVTVQKRNKKEGTGEI